MFVWNQDLFPTLVSSPGSGFLQFLGSDPTRAADADRPEPDPHRPAAFRGSFRGRRPPAWSRNEEPGAEPELIPEQKNEIAAEERGASPTPSDSGWPFAC